MTKNTKETPSIMSSRIETIQNPIGINDVPSSFRGRITLEPNKIIDETDFCKLDKNCPTNSFDYDKQSHALKIDHGKCITCGKCEKVSPSLIKIKNNFVKASRNRNDLIETSSMTPIEKSYDEIGKELKDKIYKLFGRSLAIREVDAGSCNGCEIEINALNNPIYDIERFGIHFVSSPRHADLLLITGPASRNMEIALKRTYEATPRPKIVVAVGACGCSGGIFGDTYATTGGIDKIVPVDIYIPGCPPRPQALVYGLLLAVDKKLGNERFSRGKRHGK
jgi:Ni,Fe-hydrogenase III small subunit/formate hydrogenlyase subunit 6/NADH:ubiquinone oxidoreductase subunit I